MAITLADFDLGEIDTGLILTETQKVSAFQRAGQRISISPTGSVIKSISGITSYGVGEGKEKTASGTQSKVVIGNNKFASVVVETIEAWGYDSRIADVIFSYQPSAHAKAFDNYVAGFTALPADFVNFATLTGAEELEIATGQDASVSFDDVLSAVAEGNVTGVVLTTSMLAYMKRQRNGTTGTRVFDIVGNNDSGTIDGIPYYTITSAVQVGWVGDFSNKYFWGATDVLTPTYFVKDAGTIDDSEGVTHNLTSENKLALFHEIYQGSGLASLAYFKKIVPAGS